MSKRQSKSIGCERAKILLTGGHAGATAYAVIEELNLRKDFLWEIHFIGARKAIEGKGSLTLEQTALPKVGATFHSIFTGRVQRKFSIWTVPSLFKIPFGFLHAFVLVVKIKPKVTLSFGGYAAFPVVVASWLLGIPVVVHEQTMAAGRANRLSSVFANKIALARAESQSFFPERKTIVIGNPVSREVAKIKPKKSLGELPLLFITGGSRGSVFINNLIEEILEKLLNNYQVVHQTGDYQLAKFTNIKKKLNKHLYKRYEVYGVIAPWSWGRILEKADIIISRAGANVVSEIIVSKRPAILIPLAFAYQDEQRKNAAYAQKFGIARVCRQDSLSARELLRQIDGVKKDWGKILKEVKNRQSPDVNSAARLVDLVRELIRCL